MRELLCLSGKGALICSKEGLQIVTLPTCGHGPRPCPFFMYRFPGRAGWSRFASLPTGRQARMTLRRLSGYGGLTQEDGFQILNSIFQILNTSGSTRDPLSSNRHTE